MIFLFCSFLFFRFAVYRAQEMKFLPLQQCTRKTCKPAVANDLYTRLAPLCAAGVVSTKPKCAGVCIICLRSATAGSFYLSHARIQQFRKVSAQESAACINNTVWFAVLAAPPPKFHRVLRCRFVYMWDANASHISCARIIISYLLALIGCLNHAIVGIHAFSMQTIWNLIKKKFRAITTFYIHVIQLVLNSNILVFHRWTRVKLVLHFVAVIL